MYNFYNYIIYLVSAPRRKKTARQKLAALYLFKNSGYNRSMPNDMITLKAHAKELSEALAGGKINKISAAGGDIFYIFLRAKGKNRILYASVRSEVAGIFLTERTAGEFGALPDDRPRPVLLPRRGERPVRQGQAVPPHAHLDGVEGAGRHAGAAERAARLVILDLPVQIVAPDILGPYCFHLCTARSLSMSTSSRSLG